MCSQSIFLVSLEWQRNKEQNLEKHLQLIIGIYVSDLPLNSTGRSSSSLRHHLGTMPPAPQACITYVPQKELQTKVTLTSHCAPAAAASPCMNASQLPFIRRYHTASTRTSWCYTAKITSRPCCTFNSFALFCLLKKKNHPRLCPCKDWTNHASSPAYLHSIIDPIIEAKASFLAGVN